MTKIVCIKSTGAARNKDKYNNKGIIWPKVGSKYTIRGHMRYLTGVKAYLLEEIKNEKILNKHNILFEIGFPKTWFVLEEEYYEAENAVYELLKEITEKV